MPPRLPAAAYAVAGAPASAAAAATSPSGGAKAQHGLRIGQSVFHDKFGEGVVTTLEGRGADARAQVHFVRHGSKWLALAVARLTPLE